jgi:hypothetical protein
VAPHVAAGTYPAPLDDATTRPGADRGGFLFLHDPRYGILRLTPTRTALVEFPAPSERLMVWHAKAGRQVR